MRLIRSPVRAPYRPAASAYPLPLPVVAPNAPHPRPSAPSTSFRLFGDCVNTAARMVRVWWGVGGGGGGGGRALFGGGEGRGALLRHALDRTARGNAVAALGALDSAGDGRQPRGRASMMALLSERPFPGARLPCTVALPSELQETSAPPGGIQLSPTTAKALQDGGPGQGGDVDIAAFSRKTPSGKASRVRGFIMHIQAGHYVPARPFLPRDANDIDRLGWVDKFAEIFSSWISGGRA